MNDLHLTLSDVPNIALAIAGFTISIVILCNWQNNYWSRTTWGALGTILLTVTSTTVLTRAIMGNWMKANSMEQLYNSATWAIYFLDAVLIVLMFVHVYIEDKRTKDTEKKLLEDEEE